MDPSADQCASEILEAIPLIMRSIRAELRRSRSPDLSVPQFRTLAFLKRNKGTSLSSVADHIGIRPPSASKIVDGLVIRRLAIRRVCARDRRHVELSLTASGETTLRAIRKRAKAFLVDKLTSLSRAEMLQIIQSMQRLRPVFASGVSV